MVSWSIRINFDTFSSLEDGYYQRHLCGQAELSLAVLQVSQAQGSSDLKVKYLIWSSFVLIICLSFFFFGEYVSSGVAVHFHASVATDLESSQCIWRAQLCLHLYIYIRYIYIYDFSLEQFRFEPCMDENGSTLTNSLVHSVNPVSYLSLFQIYWLRYWPDCPLKTAGLCMF